MGKMKFGPKITAETITIPEPVPKAEPAPVIIPENRPSPKEVLISRSECDAAKLVHVELEKYKQNALAKFDKHKRRLNQLPAQIEQVEVRLNQHVNIKAEELNDQLESISVAYGKDIAELCADNKTLEKKIELFQKESKQLKFILGIIATIAVIGVLI